ncbi:MAG TPA: serine/threonine protein kinase [Deltaproteobacteria bacterium]|nr:serine/threonine protein kinase [Deltaproteobacteria bacterium]
MNHDSNTPRDGGVATERYNTDPLGLVNNVVGERYHILHLLARGGMGLVYLARQEALDREVVVKIAFGEAADEDTAERFQREARSLSRLSHPNIVQLFDFGRDARTGLLFIAMEYVRGTTLSRYLKDRGRLPFDHFLPIMQQIVAGVAEAHRGGLIHRDLKPSNIMLTSSDRRTVRVKILDFGLSKLMTDSPLTRVDQVIGSAMYMAPEQLRGQTVDTRADVYALGVLSYQLLTGSRPYPGEDSSQILAQQVHGRFVPMVQSLPRVHDVPPALIELIELCLSSNPGHRPPNAIALEEALEAAVGHAPTGRFASTLPSQTPVPAQPYPSGGHSHPSGRYAHPSGSYSGSFHPSGGYGLPYAQNPSDYSQRYQIQHPLSASQTQSSIRSKVGIAAGLTMGMVTILSIFVVCVLALILVVMNQSPQRATAPPAAEQAKSATAEVLRDRALRAMREQNYDLSISLLTEAIKVAPEGGDNQALLDIVMDLRDNSEAPPTTSAVVEVEPQEEAQPADTRPPRPRGGKRAKTEAAPPRPKPNPTGIAVLTSTPLGLSFRIPGLPEGTTPAQVSLPLGSHKVEMFQDGTLVYTGTVEAKLDEVGVVDFALPEPEPPLSEQPSGGSPDGGPEAEGDREQPTPVTPPPGVDESGEGIETSEAEEPEESGPIAMGELVIESPNLYGEVIVNGEPQGFPPVRVMVPIGPATIAVKTGRAVRKTKSVVVEEGSARIVLR